MKTPIHISKISCKPLLTFFLFLQIISKMVILTFKQMDLIQKLAFGISDTLSTIVPVGEFWNLIPTRLIVLVLCVEQRSLPPINFTSTLFLWPQNAFVLFKNNSQLHFVLTSSYSLFNVHIPIRKRRRGPKILFFLYVQKQTCDKRTNISM